MRKNCHFFITLSFVCCLAVMNTGESKSQDNTDKPLILFAGTYTNSTSVGIYVYTMDPFTGIISQAIDSVKESNPSYLAVHPNKKWLYSANENDPGTVSAFCFDIEKKKLTLINTVPNRGKSPCYIHVDLTGHFLMTANYSSGNISVLPVNQDGSIGNTAFTDSHQGNGPVGSRQEGPHAHMITQGPNAFVYYTDLGLDQIFIYSLVISNGTLRPAKENVHTDPGAGPRHLAFHPFQPWAYIIGELSGTIECFAVNSTTGTFTKFDVISALPSGEKKEAASADIHITPDGKYLYVSNRSNYNNIAMYTIEKDTGKLKRIGHQSTLGKTPRNFVIDPSGKFLLVANQNSNNVVVFRIDPVTGKLEDTNQRVNVPSPVCLKFL